MSFYSRFIAIRNGGCSFEGYPRDDPGEISSYIKQFLKDGQEQQPKGARLSPALPQSSDDHLWSGDDAFNFDDPLDDFNSVYEPDDSLSMNTSNASRSFHQDQAASAQHLLSPKQTP